MIWADADVSGLSRALKWWEYGEYFFSFVVALACFGEYIADFMPRWYQTGDAERDLTRKDTISKVSTLVLVAALVCELVCLTRSNADAGQVIKSIDTVATNASEKSKTAFEKAGKAHDLAQKASDIAGPAKATADAAKDEADAVRKSAECSNQTLADLRIQAERLRRAEADRVFNKERPEVGRRLKGKQPYLLTQHGNWGVQLEFEYLENAGCSDCKELPPQISRIARDFANWKVIGSTTGTGSRDEEKFFEGVAVQLNTGGDTPEVAEWLRAAASRLVKELNRAHITAAVRAPRLEDPKDVMVVRVGRKPIPPPYPEKVIKLCEP